MANAKTLEVVTDVPWSVPSEVGVILDLPAKKFAVNPKIAVPVVLGLVTVGAIAAVQVWKKRKNAKDEAENVDQDLDDAANAELDEMAKASEPKPKPSKKNDTPSA